MKQPTSKSIWIIGIIGLVVVVSIAVLIVVILSGNQNDTTDDVTATPSSQNDVADDVVTTPNNQNDVTDDVVTTPNNAKSIADIRAIQNAVELWRINNNGATYPTGPNYCSDLSALQGKLLIDINFTSGKNYLYITNEKGDGDNATAYRLIAPLTDTNHAALANDVETDITTTSNSHQTHPTCLLYTSPSPRD